MSTLPPKSPPQSATPSGDFVPEKISIDMRHGRRRGQSAGSAGAASGEHTDNDVSGSGGSGSRQHHLNASQTSAISDSVVFHEDSELFDEIDDLYPHGHEGGKLVSDPNSSTSNTSYSQTDDGTSSRRPRSDSTRSYTDNVLQSIQNSGLGDLILTDYDSLVRSTNDDTLAQMIAGIEDRFKGSTTLSQASKGNLSGNSSNSPGGKGSKRDSIVGGTQMSDMSFKEQRELLAPERSSRSLVIDLEDDGDDDDIGLKEAGDKGGPGRDLLNSVNSSKSQHTTISYSPTIASDENPNNVLVSSVDWSSLSKSCKRAKNAFRDVDSGQMVVKNMFVTHLSALIMVLTSYANRYCTNNQENGNSCSLEEIKARTTETKRALRFAMSCLAPPRMEEDSSPSGETEAQDDMEKYRCVRQYRQELQETAVRGCTSRPSSPITADDGDMGQRRDLGHHYGVQIPLVEIIFSGRPWNVMESDANQFANGDSDKRATIVSSIEREKRTVRTLAARLMCNLVTDNPLAAEIVLRDVPFAPTPDEVESRMARSILGSGELSNGAASGKDMVIFWSDLIAATAKVQGPDAINNGNGKTKNDSQDREALAAVAAALHNLLTSLEARESLLELNDEMKRRENSKHRREVSRQDSAVSGSSGTISELEVEHQSVNPIDVGFEVASNGPLLNSLLRNILPARAVLMQSKLEKEQMEMRGPTFKPPASAAEDLSDSATEWISLVLERLASRGLLPNMLRSAGGSKPGHVTPEQVVLVSCIRQAVDDFSSALTPAGETGGFGRRRLSIAAKTAGMAMTTRPHPLWGRADMGASGRAVPGRDSRNAVPVLLALANEAEEIRLRVDELRENESNELYDGERNCTVRVIDDICDILAQTLGRHTSTSIDGNDSPKNKHCFLGDARSVLGRETTLVSSCCKDLGRILDAALARNAGKKARELALSALDQQTAIVMVRLLGNIVYECRYNQDLLRITPVPALEIANDTSAPSKTAATNTNSNNGAPVERTGLHVLLSATSLSTACFTLREWCIVAIRNAVENNAANAETVRRLEVNQVLDDTPELRKMGVKVEMDAQGKVNVKRGDR